MKEEIASYVGSKIKYYRKKAKMTQKELGEKIGVKHNTISSYENGTNEADHDILFSIANILDISINDFFPPTQYDVEEKTSFIKKESTYPYIHEPISAGLPETVDCEKIKEISLPNGIMGKYANQKNVRIMRTNGESMNRVIPNGCLIAVKSVAIENIKDGDIVVYHDNYDYAVKRIYRSGNKVIFRPDSTDPTFTDYVTEADEQLNIIGKVVLYIVELD